MTENYVIHTTFSGSDMISVVNGNAIGEVSGIHFTEHLKPVQLEDGTWFTGVIGEVETVFFGDRFAFRDALNETGADTFVIRLANEYGAKGSLTFGDIEFTKRIMQLDVDNVILNETYHFRAKSVTPGDYVCGSAAWETKQVNNNQEAMQ